MEYIFLVFLSSLIIFSSFLVIYTRNPVISMLYLILVFIQTSMVFLCLGAEFLFILFLIVYVGAVAILFLFVIMLLNLRVVENYNIFYNYMPVGLFIGFYFIFFVIYFIFMDFNAFSLKEFILEDNFSNYWISFIFFKSNMVSIGELFYNYCNHYFVLAGFLLLIALLGVIYLTIDLSNSKNIQAAYDSYRLPYINVFSIDHGLLR